MLAREIIMPPDRDAYLIARTDRIVARRAAFEFRELAGGRERSRFMALGRLERAIVPRRGHGLPA